MSGLPTEKATGWTSGAGGVVLLAVALGSFVGAGLFLIDHSNASSYMSNDPDSCVNCHIMRTEHDAWTHSSHHAVAVCNDCHVPQDTIGKYTMKAVHGFRHSKGFTLQDFHEPIMIKADSLKVVEANCLRCHSDITSQINAHGFAAKPGDNSLSCVHCHSGVGHATGK